MPESPPRPALEGDHADPPEGDPYEDEGGEG
jgi:hypothetical protein